MTHFKNTRQIHASSYQEIRCIECQWCCKYEVHKINPKYLKVYWLKNVPLMWDPHYKMWFAVYKCECNHCSKQGCKIYDSIERPQACDEYMCPVSRLTMAKAYPIWLKASYNILHTLIVLRGID